jgi:hypothetical protein
VEHQKLSLLVQLATGIAVLFGLALVVWELQQTRQIAEAQRVNDGYTLLINDVRSMLGESFGEVYAKGCIEPSKLTDGEILQMREYYDANLFLIRRMRDIDVTEAFTLDWEEYAPGYIRHWLDSKVGRLHYEDRLRRGLDPKIQQIAAEILESDLTTPCNDLATFAKRVRANE